jgi:hypothetical protein
MSLPVYIFIDRLPIHGETIILLSVNLYGFIDLTPYDIEYYWESLDENSGESVCYNGELELSGYKLNFLIGNTIFKESYYKESYYILSNDIINLFGG